jgi:hypothetical protein
MKLFKVNPDMATYWVAANDADQATHLVWEEEVKATTTEEANESMTGVEAQEITEEVARKTLIRDDDTGGDRTLWDFFRDTETPTVLACSEWV